MTFLLVWDKDSYTESFLVIFHLYMCHTTKWLIFSNYLHSNLVPQVWWKGDLMSCQNVDQIYSHRKMITIADINTAFTVWSTFLSAG
jgi:hypothetical protein